MTRLGRPTSRATLTTITVPLSVVAVLREGLLIDLSSAADLLGRLTASGRLEESGPFWEVIARIDAARNLLGQVGVLPPEHERSIELELNDYKFTAYRIVAARQARAIQAAEDAEHEGRPCPAHDPALEQFVSTFNRLLEARDSARRRARR